MAVKINDESGSDLSEISDINVTPFIDVMLVLLIIFMIAAPLSTVDIKVDLPASSAEPQKLPPTPTYVSLQLDESTYIGEKKITRAELERELDAATQRNKDAVIFLRADKEIKYELLMSLMDDLRKANYLKIALVGMEKL